MNPFWTQIIIQTTLKHKRDKNDKSQEYSNYELAKGWREFRISVVRFIQDLVLITMGIFSAAFGFKGFLLTNRFIDGGATGISLLISALTSIPLWVLIICVNIPFMILAFNTISKAFAVKTILAIAGLALVLATVSFPDVTKDNLLVAVFGGFFLELVLAYRSGAAR